jgi:hypothetical protein
MRNPPAFLRSQSALELPQFDTTSQLKAAAATQATFLVNMLPPISKSDQSNTRDASMSPQWNIHHRVDPSGTYGLDGFPRERRRYSTGVMPVRCRNQSWKYVRLSNPDRRATRAIANVDVARTC